MHLHTRQEQICKWICVVFSELCIIDTVKSLAIVLHNVRPSCQRLRILDIIKLFLSLLVLYLQLLDSQSIWAKMFMLAYWMEEYELCVDA